MVWFIREYGPDGCVNCVSSCVDCLPRYIQMDIIKIKIPRHVLQHS